MAKEVKTGEFGVLEVLNAKAGDSRLYLLKPGSFVIGSSANAKIRLPLSKEIKDLHCIVHVREDGLATLEPQAVFNPTKLNNKIIPKYKKPLLKPGDIFDIGDIKILYRNDFLTEQDLQQRSKFLGKTKLFGTPLIIAKQATITDSAKKKLNPAFSRLMIMQRRRSSACSPHEKASTSWATDILQSRVLPSPSNLKSDPIEENKSPISRSTTPSLRREKMRSSSVTPSSRASKRISSLMSTDSNDSEKSLSSRKSLRLIKSDLTEVTSSEMAAPKTTKKSIDKFPDRLSTAMSSRQTPKKFSKYDEYLLFGEPLTLRRTASVSNLGASEHHSKSVFRNKSFVEVLNKRADTPKTPTIFKTPTSAVKKSLKLSKPDKGIKDVISSPVPLVESAVACRSRSLSNASRRSANITMEVLKVNKSLVEDVESTDALSPIVQTRRSARKSENSMLRDLKLNESPLNDDDEKDEEALSSAAFSSSSIASRRSRSLLRNSKQFGNKMLNTSDMDNERVESSPVSTFPNIEVRRSRRSLLSDNQSRPSDSKPDKGARGVISSPVPLAASEVTRRSRSLSNVSRRSANSTMEVLKVNRSLVEDALSPIVQTRRSARKSENSMLKDLKLNESSVDDDENDEEALSSTVSSSSSIASRRSRSLLRDSKQFDNKTLSTSDIGNEQIESSPVFAFPNIEVRRSRRSLLSDKQSRCSESKPDIGARDVISSPVPLVASEVTPRSRSLSNVSRRSANTTMEVLKVNRLLVEDVLSPIVQTRRSARKSENSMLKDLKLNESSVDDDENDEEAVSSSSSITSRRSRSLLRDSKQFDNKTLSTSDIGNEQIELSPVFSFPNNEVRRSRRSLLSDKQSRHSESSPFKKLQRKAAVWSPLCSLSSPETGSSGSSSLRRSNKVDRQGGSSLNIAGRKSRSSTAARKSENALKKLESSSGSSFSQFTNVMDEDPEEVHDSSFNSEGSKTLGSSIQSSSFIDTTDSSSFIYENSPHSASASSLKLTENVCNVSGIEELTKTPKQKIQEKNTSSRKSAFLEGNTLNTSMRHLTVADLAAMRNDVSSLIRFSDTVSEDTSSDVDNNSIEMVDDSKIVEQNVTADNSSRKSVKKTPKNDVSDVKQMFNKSKSPKNDLSDVRGVKRIMATPKAPKSPKNDLSDIRGVKKIMKTPKAQKSPKNDLSNVSGVEQLLATSTIQNSPKNDLRDLSNGKKTMKTPKVVKSPKNDLTDVKGVKQLLKTPFKQNSPKNDLRDVKGVKKIMKTPKVVKSPKNDLTDVKGVKQLLRTPFKQNSPMNDLTDVRGVKRILKTPKPQKSPENDLSDPSGIKKLFEIPKIQKLPKNDLTDLKGVKQLLKTPAKQNSPKNDLTDVRGVKGILKTPKAPKSPRNDLSNPPGFKKLFEIPKSPTNDLDDLKGVEELLATPAPPKTPKNNLRDVRGVKQMLKDANGSAFGDTLSTVQVIKVDYDRRVSSSKRTREKEPESDYTDVRGVKRMFAEEEAASKNISNISGVADLFNESSATNSTSEVFTALFNKKPLRTYKSKSPSPYKFNQLGMSRKSVDISPPVSSHVVNWVNSIGEQIITNELDTANEILPQSTPLAPLKRSRRLASKTPTPSPLVTRRVRSVKENPSEDIESDETQNEANVKKSNRGILKETISSHKNSPITGKRTRKNKDLTETTKENVTPEASDTASDIQAKKVTFVTEAEETRRSKRTPRKPAKFSGFLSGLELASKDVEKKVQETQKQSSPSEESKKQKIAQEEVVKPARSRRGNKIEKEIETNEEPSVRKRQGKQVTLNKEVGQQEIESEDKKPAKRRRGKLEVAMAKIDQENDESQASIENGEDNKPAKRRRGKQEVDKKVDQEEIEELPAIIENVKELPMKRRGRKQKVNETVDEPELKKKEEKQIKTRGRKAVTEKVDESENESEVNTTKEIEQKPVTRRGRKAIKEKVDDSESEQKPKTKHGQKPVNVKVDHSEEEDDKRPVRTRGRQQKVITEDVIQNDSRESEMEEKPVTRRGRKQAVNTKKKQLETVNSEEAINKSEVDEKPAPKRRGRKLAVEQQIVVEEDLDEKSETTNNSEVTPLQRTTRKRTAAYADIGDSSNNSNRGKRAKQEIVQNVPVRKSARTRK